MIVFDQVTKIYHGNNPVLDEISFKISPGEFVIITGSSGSGKTTIGRLLIRELLPTSGTITVNGEEITSLKFKSISTLRRQIGVIFQDYKIIPDKTVAENIALILEIVDLPSNQINDRIDKLLELVGISSKKNLFPSQLSGGELQRAAIARAISTDPKILFADEPTGNLDTRNTEEIFNLLQKINSTGTTVIMSTHDERLFHHSKYRQIHLEKGKLIEDSEVAKESTATKSKSKK